MRNKDMRNKAMAVVMFVVAVYCGGALSESGAEESAQKKQDVNQVEKETVKIPKKKKPVKEFTPSEEISIDKPVAFPVDI